MPLGLFLSTLGRFVEFDFSRFAWFRDSAGSVIVVFSAGMDTVYFN